MVPVKLSAGTLSGPAHADSAQGSQPLFTYFNAILIINIYERAWRRRAMSSIFMSGPGVALTPQLRVLLDEGVGRYDHFRQRRVVCL